LNEIFNQEYDEVSIGETNDRKLLEALENMVLNASKGLFETQDMALRDLEFQFRDI